MANGKLSVDERLRLLDEMLHREQGVTSEQYLEKTNCEFHPDKKLAQQLLKEVGWELTKEKVDGEVHYYLSDQSVHLHQLRNHAKGYRNNGDILDFIHHADGLPQVWAQKMIGKDEPLFQERIIISFEPLFDDSKQDEDCMTDGYGNYRVNGLPNKLRKLYQAALDMCAVRIKVREFHKESYAAILYPEYLKQYLNKWYVFGMLKKEGETEVHFERLPLLRIGHDIRRDQTIEFEKSYTDYASYFDDIIGVDKMADREPCRVVLAVKESALKRVMTGVLGNKLELNGGKLSDGRHLCEMTIRRNKELDRVLLQYGADIKVLSPKKLADTIRKEAERVVGLYAKGEE